MKQDQPPQPAKHPARFIVGMPRAATTWLCKCFNEHPETAAFGESMFFGRRYLPPQSDGTYSPQQIRLLAKRLADGTCLQSVRFSGPGNLRSVSKDNLAKVVDDAFSQLPPGSTPASVFSAFANEVAALEGKHAAIEKTPHHLNWLDRIFSAFPDARVVVLLREPYAFMLSYKHQGDRKSEQLRRTLARLYHPLACALIWRASMRSALAAKEQYRDLVHFCDQRELKADAAAVMKQIQRFFLLPIVEDLASKVPPDNTSFPGEVKPQLQAEDYFWMNLIAGRTIDRAGYARQRGKLSPAAVLRIGWSLVRLPWWALGTLWLLRQKVDGSLTAYIVRWFRPARQKATVAASE